MSGNGDILRDETFGEEEYETSRRVWETLLRRSGAADGKPQPVTPTPDELAVNQRRIAKLLGWLIQELEGADILDERDIDRALLFTVDRGPAEA